MSVTYTDLVDKLVLSLCICI